MVESTSGEIIVARSKPKFADYMLYLNDGKPIVVVEAKDNNHSVSHGLQQAMTYAQMMDLPFAYSSNGDAFYETKIVGDGESALREFPSFKPNLVLLDLMLPGIDGYQVCRELRTVSQVPIIMLSAKGEIFDKVLGLELGADDYMIKPFDSKELVARVKAVLRRYQAGSSAVSSVPKQQGEFVEYPDLVVNLTNYSVLYKGRSVDMPPKELELLYFLASSPNQVFTREQLLDHIWGYEYIGDTRTVDVHIKRLREKIKDNEYWSLSTVWGIGYKFEVKR